jgi:hypothetical protein
MANNQKTSFAIIANIAFGLIPVIAGGFNSHHKGRLVKAGNTGKVTEEGAAFFSNRPRLADKELTAAVEEAGFKLADLPAGFKWAINARGAAWQAGQGKVGQTLFANALSSLTQAAKAAEEKAAKAEQAKANRAASLAKANAARAAKKAATVSA